MNLSDRTSESADNMTFSDQRRFTKSPQVILLSLVHIRLTPKWSVCRRQLPPVRRLLDAARSNNQVLDQTDVLKSKISAIRLRNLQCSTSIENDGRLPQTQPGSRSEMDKREELEALDRLRRAHSHAFSQLHPPGKWKEAKRVPPDAQILFQRNVFGNYLLEMMLILKLHLAIASMMLIS